VVEAWLTAGVRLLQLRAKTMAGGPMLELADRIQRHVSAAGALFVVNDRADIARMCRAAGVHVGQDDLAPEDVRRVVGDTALVGLSTHNVGQLRAAASAPVDYVAVGPVYGTSSKERPDPVVGLDGVRSAKAIVEDRPLVAIGGITLDRAPALIAAGADVVAVIADLLIGDVEKRAREFLAALR
jgi:thiamine-phosphate pyrophosphorylase